MGRDRAGHPPAAPGVAAGEHAGGVEHSLPLVADVDVDAAGQLSDGPFAGGSFTGVIAIDTFRGPVDN